MKQTKRNIIRIFKYVGIFPILILLLIFVDGFNILTKNWQRGYARIIEVEHIERRLQTKYGASRPRISSNAKIKFTLNNQEHIRNIIITHRVDKGQDIEIRFTSDGNFITASRLNYPLYFILLTMLISYIMLIIILEVIPKIYEAKIINDMKKNRK